MQVPFHTIFDCHEDGSVSPKMNIRINGLIRAKAGQRMYTGKTTGGIDFALGVGRDLEVDYLSSELPDVKDFYMPISKSRHIPQTSVEAVAQQ